MKLFPELGHAWAAEMNAADRLRVVLAWGFVFGAVSHIGWVVVHGDVWYHGPGPIWAPAFWYSICVVDLIVYWLLLYRPRAGLALGVATMIITLMVNWTQFPTFEFSFNYVLIGLTAFGLVMFGTVAWLWRASRWTANHPSSTHTGG
jgi:hypothetical protein